MKGISAVIAIIMVLLLTISISGLAFLIFSRTTEDTGEDVGGFAEGQLKQLGADLRVEGASGNKVYIRNTGTNDVPNTTLAFYINDQLILAYSDIAAIEPGQIVEFTLNRTLVDNDILTVSGGKKTVGIIIKPTTTTIGVTTTNPGATPTTIPTTPCWALTGDAASFIAYGIANDSTSMYIAGIGEGPDWRIEKRLLTDSSAVAAFGTSGVVTGPASTHAAYDTAIDGNYMYVAGSELTSSVNWRIEKRSLVDGALDPTFGTAGVITGDTFTNTITSIAVDGTYMYLFGLDDSSKWRIEKRLLTDGNLVPAFGTSGVVTGDATTALAEDMSLYSTYIYLAGSDSNGDWRIEKRRADDGTLEGTFGTAGVVTGSAVTESVYAIAVDGTYMYLAGTEVSGIRNWHIEKRLLTDGSLVPTFGTGGMITGDAVSETPSELITDQTYMFIIGSNDNNANWRTEKRRLDNGNLDTTFGSSGVLNSDAATKIGYDLLLAGNYLYEVGYDDNNNWRIEKRLATTGEISPCAVPTTTTTTTTLPSIISFVAPTDPIGTYARNTTYTNLSVTEPSVDSVWVDWNGTKITVDSPSLVGAWNFDNNTIDSSRYGNNGKFLNGNSSVCNTTLAGRFGGACTFDGTNDIINVTYSSSLNMSRDKKFTIMFWAKPFTVSPNKPILTKGIVGQIQYSLYMGSVTGQPLRFNIGGVETECSNFFTANQWDHMAVTYNGSMQFYLNGQLRCSTFMTVPNMYTDTTDLSIAGGAPFGSNYYRGLLDEVRIYSTNLSDAEIAAIYNTGTGKYFANITEFGIGQYVYQGFVNSTAGVQSTTEARIFTQSDCTGNVVFSTNPTSTTPGGSVTPSASSLTNCNGKAVQFRYFSCAGTWKSACTVDAAGGCTGAAFNVQTTLGNQTYLACIDKNGDGDTNDFGENNGQLVSVCTNGYPDADSDGRYNGTFVSGLCSGSYTSSPPASADCNDADSTKYQYLTGYLDADADTYTIGESGWRSPASPTNDAGIGTIPWLSPSNVIADDNVHSNATMSDSAITNYLIATNFGFSLPPNATVTGIRADIERKAETGSSVRDDNVKLIKGGVISGDNKALTTASWGNTNGISRTYGGPGDLWVQTWTTADINSPTFGFAINVKNYLTTSATASIDRIRMSVYYSDSGSQVCSGASLPTGYRSTATNNDCYDNNANAKPGQATYFTTERGDGIFDYNCDNVDTLRWVSDTCSDCSTPGCTALCFNPANYLGSSTPACGASGNIIAPASYTTDGTCTSGYRYINCNSISRTQECR